MKNKKIIAVVSVLAIIAVAIALFGALSGRHDTMGSMDMSSMSSSNSNNQATATNAVSIKEYMFTPADITVKVGTTVTWTNEDAVEHNIVADNTSSDAPNGPLIAQGKTYSFTFNKAGTYTYHCMPHPYMKGTVTVTN